jgi:hypothetical protein
VKRTALHRKSRLRRKRPTERRSSRVRDEAYLAWVRLQPCRVRSMMETPFNVGFLLSSMAPNAYCWGPSDPEHQREGVGMGQKASDRDAWPCCRTHHGQRHDLSGVFKGWTREQMRSFIRDRIAEANAAYERHLAAAVPA